MSRLARDGTAEPVSRDQILRRQRGQGNINFPCSADHVQGWQPYLVDPYFCHMCDQYENIQCNNRMHANYFNTHATQFQAITKRTVRFLHDTFELFVLFEIKRKMSVVLLIILIPKAAVNIV